MTATNQVAKTLGEQMADLLLRKPKNFDVTFRVGPDKIEVNAVKFILKAASPVFEREFDETWENGEVTESNGISLPNFDPTVFQLFVNLLILDAWSGESLKSLNLSPNNLLNLLGLCRRYEITKAIRNLEEAASTQSFSKCKDTDEFLEISRENLETVLSFENIELDETKIFECAFRWASNQCTIHGLEPTGENYREVLGPCLFEIRFPTMSVEEFTKVGLLKKNFLKAEEKLAVYEYIGLHIDEKTYCDKSQLPFKTNRRGAAKLSRINMEKPPPRITTDTALVNSSSLSGFSVLSLPPKYKLTTSPSFACDGSQQYKLFQANQKISLHGFGFLGPIDGDAHFDVTVQIKRWIHTCYTFDSGTFRKNILAQKGKLFHFLLDEPIEVESNTYDSDWGKCYEITFSLKGPKNISQYKVDKTKEELLEASGVQFHLSSEWDDKNPLAEFLFKI